MPALLKRGETNGILSAINLYIKGGVETANLSRWHPNASLVHFGGYKVNEKKIFCSSSNHLFKWGCAYAFLVTKKDRLYSCY